MVLIFAGPEDEILKCDYPNKSEQAVFSHAISCQSVQGGSRICGNCKVGPLKSQLLSNKFLLHCLLDSIK